VNLDASALLLALLSIVTTGLSFFARELWTSYKELQKVVFAMKEELPKQYLQRDDFRNFRTEVLDAIHRLEGYVRESLQVDNQRK
jgi:hypothetical protein